MIQKQCKVRKTINSEYCDILNNIIHLRNHLTLAPSSSGQDIAFSRQEQGFDFPRGHKLNFSRSERKIRARIKSDRSGCLKQTNCLKKEYLTGTFMCLKKISTECTITS